MAKTKKRPTTAAKPVTRTKVRSTSNGVVSSRTKARRQPVEAPVVDLTPEEYAAYLERQVQREMGMSVAEFTRAFAAGEIDLAHPAVYYLVGKLRIGQNGHKAVA